MMNRTVKRKWLKARIALNSTVQKILDINRKKQSLPFFENPRQQERVINEELRILNRIAEQQNKLIKRYENEKEVT
jgi:hypothetical protein